MGKFITISSQNFRAACLAYFIVAFARIRKSDHGTTKNLSVMGLNLLIGIEIKIAGLNE